MIVVGARLVILDTSTRPAESRPRKPLLESVAPGIPAESAKGLVPRSFPGPSSFVPAARHVVWIGAKKLSRAGGSDRVARSGFGMWRWSCEALPPSGGSLSPSLIVRALGRSGPPGRASGRRHWPSLRKTGRGHRLWSALNRFRKEKADPTVVPSTKQRTEEKERPPLGIRHKGNGDQ